MNDADFAVPDGFVTVIVPDFAFAGTTNVNFVAETTLNFAGTPWIVTDVVPVKFVPVRVTVLPGAACAGAILVIVGTGAVNGRKPSLTKIAWPAGLKTLLMKA